MGKYLKLWFLEHWKWANYQGSGSVLRPGSPRLLQQFPCSGAARASTYTRATAGPDGTFWQFLCCQQAMGSCKWPQSYTDLMESGPYGHIGKPLYLLSYSAITDIKFLIIHEFWNSCTFTLSWVTNPPGRALSLSLGMGTQGGQGHSPGPHFPPVHSSTAQSLDVVDVLLHLLLLDHSMKSLSLFLTLF